MGRHRLGTAGRHEDRQLHLEGCSEHRGEQAKIQFCTDLPDGRVGIVDARGFSDINDKDLQSFVKSVKFADDVNEAYDKAKEVSSDDLKIH